MGNTTTQQNDNAYCVWKKPTTQEVKINDQIEHSEIYMDIVNQLYNFGFGTYDDIIHASKSAVNAYDINEICDILRNQNRLKIEIKEITPNLCNSNENKLDVQNITCEHNKNIHKCYHLNQLIQIMQEYMTKGWSEENTRDITHILDHYFHLIHYHGSTDADFEVVFNQLGGICHASKCKSFSRNYRDRAGGYKEYEVYDGYEMLVDDNESKTIIIQQLLDKIHCYYSHCFDIGHKMTIMDRNELTKTIINLN
eukprot:528537_1